MEETDALGPSGRWGRWVGLAVFAPIWFSPAPVGLPASAQRLAADATG
ncbi:MAG: hypothetical protein U0872_11725 [Planctomycetaceae bacterium]